MPFISSVFPPSAVYISLNISLISNVSLPRLPKVDLAPAARRAPSSCLSSSVRLSYHSGIIPREPPLICTHIASSTFLSPLWQDTAPAPRLPHSPTRLVHQTHIPSHNTCEYLIHPCRALFSLTVRLPGSSNMANTRRLNALEYRTFCPGEPPLHQRKFGMSIRDRGRAHEAVNNSWYFACMEVDINMRRPGAYGPPKENIGVRFARWRRELPSEGSRWLACADLDIPRALIRRHEINRDVHRQKLGGFDPAVVRGKCTRFGKRCVSLLASSSSWAVTDDLTPVHGKPRGKPP